MHAVRHRDDPFLFAKLEATLPDPLVVGRGNALFVSGWCFHRERKVVDLGIRANGTDFRVLTHSMPRADVFAAHDRESDPHGHRYRSGFWAILPFAAPNGDESGKLELVATLSSGQIATREIGSVQVSSSPATDGGPPAPSSTSRGEPLIAIC